MRFKALIFDMDGTLVDNMNQATESYRRAFQKITGEIFDDARLFSMFGPNCEGICKKAVPDRWEEALELFYREFESSYRETDVVVPAVKESLERFKKSGIRIGVVTGGSNRSAEHSMNYLGIGNFIEMVVPGIETGPCKPESIREVLAHFALSPSQAAYVGDTPYDMKAARKAGVTPVGAAWCGNTDPDIHKKMIAERPVKVFTSFSGFANWALEK
jgi:pyrophosphatase PpaX